MFHAVASEVAEELERAQKDQDHLQDEVARSCEERAYASRDFSERCETMSAKLCSAFREDNVLPTRQSAWKHEKLGKEPAI